MEKENSGSNFLAGVFLGTVIGLVLGILFAPQPGEKSREQLRTKIDELTSLGKMAWEEGKEAATQRGAEIHARFDKIRGKHD